ncbi:hypothetical protein LI177_14540, partial [bacterium 210820-DFI.6.37]|nr:hypothetical protein [bacterium 210820-DFI.6.37]
ASQISDVLAASFEKFKIFLPGLLHNTQQTAFRCNYKPFNCNPPDRLFLLLSMQQFAYLQKIKNLYNKPVG